MEVDVRLTSGNEVEVCLGGLKATFGIDIFKYCFKSKRVNEEMRTKHSTFSFAQYFDWGATPHIGDERLHIHNFTEAGPVKKVPLDDEFNMFVADAMEIEERTNRVDLRAFYKTFHEVYGIHAATLRKAISKKLLTLLVNSSEDYPNWEKYVNALCKRSNSNTNVRALLKLNAHRHTVKKLEQDGLVNIIPFILWDDSFNTVDDFRAEPTKFLKKYFGKSLWKKVLKQSFTRNAIISKRYAGVRDWHGFMGVREWPITLVKYSSNNSHTLNAILGILNQELTTPNHDRNKTAIVVKRNMEKFIKGYAISTRLGREQLIRDLHMVRDTVQTYRRDRDLDYGVNWDYRMDLNIILTAHNHVLQVYREAHPPVANLFAKVDDKPLDYSWVEERFSLTGDLSGVPYRVLHTDELIRIEAERMFHCVDSYSERVGQGTYLVIHVGEDAPKGFTVGCEVGGNKIRKDQAYGYDNEILSSVGRALCDKLVRQLQKENDKFLKSLQKADTPEEEAVA